MKNFLRKHDSVITVAMVIAAILFAMIFCGVIIALTGVNPLKAYREFARGVFGSVYGFGDTMNKFTPLLCAGISYSIASRSGFMNLGAEGQMGIGAVVSVALALALGDTNPIIGVLVPIIGGVAAGALLCAICGALKIWFNASDMLSTLMFNYVVQYFIQWLVANPLKNPEGNMEQSAAIPESSKLLSILPGSRLHYGLLIAIAALVVVWFIQQRTVSGFEMRLSGANSTAARYVGVNEKKALIVVILIAGAVAGLGGALELQGNQYKLMSGISNGFGFDGIGIAVMGKYTPIGIFFSTFLYAALRTGSAAMQRGCNVPQPMLYILQGVLLISVIISGYFVNKIRASLVERRGE